MKTPQSLHGPQVFIALALAAPFLIRAADPVWKVTPPPPASWQRDRVADLGARRKAAMEQVGPGGILILYAAEPRNYAGDVDWPYRQENNFYYLTGIDQAGNGTVGNFLVLIPGAAKYKEILFMAPSNPAQESWTGHVLLPEEARQVSGIDAVWDARLFRQFLSTVLPDSKSVFMPEPAGGRGGRGGRGMPDVQPPPVDVATEFRWAIDLAAKRSLQVWMIAPARRNPEFTREQAIAKQLGALTPPYAVKDATPIFAALRKVKSPREVDILRHAVDITAEAFQRAYALAVPGTPEYEIQAQFEFTFLRRNAHWGYPCIVASGTNATTLHYETNKDTMHDGDLLLMDDAAEFDGYSVDVTRTIPVNGKFTREQSEIYRLVWNAQQAGFAKALPGHQEGGSNPDSVNGAVSAVFKEGLYKMGLITDPDSDAELRIWYNHGVGHPIGLNVHDLSSGGELQPGMVVTVEPGIYIRPDALENLPTTPENEKFIAAVRPAFEKYKGIGVRIEDDVLITSGQPKVISSGIPSKIEDVESSVAQLRKTAKTAPPQ